MNIAIFGDGRLGNEIGDLLGARTGIRPTILGRPANGRHPVATLAGVDLVFEASAGSSVQANVESALSAGVRRLVIATTAWSSARSAVDRALQRSDAAAVVAPNFSVGGDPVLPAGRRSRRPVWPARRVRSVCRRMAPRRQGRPAVGHGPGDCAPPRCGAPQEARRPGTRRGSWRTGRSGPRSRSPSCEPARARGCTSSASMPPARRSSCG